MKEDVLARSEGNKKERKEKERPRIQAYLSDILG